MIIKNKAWLMPRISLHWLHAHLSQSEQQLMLDIINKDNAVQHTLETVQAVVPVNLLQLLQNKADQMDQQQQSVHATLCEKVSSFCNGTR